MGCTVYEKDDSYIKQMPPEPLHGDELTKVHMGVDILAILEIAEVDSFIQLQLSISLTWLDGRLTMVDLNEEDDLNTLTWEARQEVWIPQVVFYNTEVKQETLNDEKAFATVKRSGAYQRRGLTSLHNAYLYRGDENPVTLSRVYSGKFICEFNMVVYPFDTQRCSAKFTMKGNSGKFIELVPGGLRYLGPIDLTQYFVEEYTIRNVTIPPGIRAVDVQLQFGRRILSTILTTYLPTFLICLVSFATNYFKGFFFEAIVTVNLTSLLVLTTLFISVSNSLPETSYIKMIDIWLLVCLFVPFSEVLLQVSNVYVNHYILEIAHIIFFPRPT